MNKFRTGSELAINKFLFKLVKQIELLNLLNRGSNRPSSGLDLTVSGWVGCTGYVVGCAGYVVWLRRLCGGCVIWD